MVDSPPTVRDLVRHEARLIRSLEAIERISPGEASMLLSGLLQFAQGTPRLPIPTARPRPSFAWLRNPERNHS